MARPSKKVKDLKQQIKALAPEEQANLIRSVMTPAIRFALTVEKIWKKQGKQDVRALNRAIRISRREVQQDREARQRAQREHKRAS